MPGNQRLEKQILRKLGRSLYDFGMIEAGDRVLVGLSGGKDSWTLLHCLRLLQQRAPIGFTLQAVTVEAGFPDFDIEQIAEFCARRGYPHHVLHSPIRDIMAAHLDPGSSPCSFCSRLRRGALYSFARAEGYTKIALGHHADDMIETLLLSQFFNGEIKSMPPVVEAEDGFNILIRPLCRVFEHTIAAFAALQQFPAVSCSCPAAGKHDRKRRRVKALLHELEAEHPGIKANLLSSLGRVRPEYLMRRRTRPAAR